MDWNIGAEARLILAGALGGAVNWLTRKANWRDGMAQVVVGGICAFYLTPIAQPVMAEMFGTIVGTPEELARLSGFVIGLGGVSVTGFILDMWNRRGALLTALMKDEKKDG